MLSVVVYFGVEYFLDKKIKKRAEKLNYEAIFFFQVLALTLESGKNLEAGIDLTCKSIDGEIMQEVKMLDDKFYNCFYDENMTFDKINYYVINKFELEEYYKEKIKKYFW